MLRNTLRWSRSHPILLAALVGAIFGAANIVMIESGGLMHKNSGGVLPLLLPSGASGGVHADALQAAYILLIEVAANVLAFALLFSAPVALVVGIRRALSRRS